MDCSPVNANGSCSDTSVVFTPRHGERQPTADAGLREVVGAEA